MIAASLSAKRRSRLAGPVVLLLGLLLTGGLYTLFSPAQAADQEASTDDIAAGRALFLVGCASCHGQNGEGVVTSRGTQYGPSLVGVGAAAVDFQVGTGRMPMAQPGAQAPVKRVLYNEEQISQLAAFVASLGPGPAIPAEESYDINAIPEDEREEAIVRGGEFFRTNCTACHNFAATGGALSKGKYAPSLVGVEPKYIFEALETGPQQMPVFSEANLTAEEKREIIAYLHSLEELPQYGGAAMGALGPVSEGLFAWLVGIGSCVAFGIWIAAHSTRSNKKKGAHA
ncbi:MAG TPA: c-type cytochrome [Nocardioidaceae bacterium]|nr:c-type cytochrome [Nocardioidaceae bacterium]